VEVGKENRTKLIAAVSLGVLAVVLLGTRLTSFFDGGSPLASTSVANPAPVNAPDFSAQAPQPGLRNTPRNRTTGKKQAAGQSMDPSLRYDLLKTSEDTKYEGTGRNIFRVFVEIPKPITPPVPDKVVNSGPPPPPPPPPINLKFYGFATPVGQAKRIFLAQGEDVFIAREGDIVDRRYKIVRISMNAVEILDVLSNNRQSIPLTQG